MIYRLFEVSYWWSKEFHTFETLVYTSFTNILLSPIWAFGKQSKKVYWLPSEHFVYRKNRSKYIVIYLSQLNCDWGKNRELWVDRKGKLSFGKELCRRTHNMLSPEMKCWLVREQHQEAKEAVCVNPRAEKEAHSGNW